MTQQERKAQEGEIVRRLTIGAGTAALGLAWFFTSSAVTAVPLAFGAQPPADAQSPAAGAEQLDDRVFVRAVHRQAMGPPAGGVRAASQAAGGVQAATTVGASSSVQAATAAPATGSPPPARPTPAPAPTAATGGSTPAK